MIGSTCVSLGELIEVAREEAVALDHAQLGTEHVLIAMAKRDLGLCSDLLRREEIDADAILAALDGTSRDGTSRDGTEEAGEETELPPTDRLTRLLRRSHEHAVMLESQGIAAEHALLAIVDGGRGTATDLVDGHSDGVGDRIEQALLGRLDGTGAAERPVFSLTAREAMALAWSQAHAVGREEIEVEDLLFAIAAPGWTIGARAAAALGTVPDWTPALWTHEGKNDAYRPIRVGEEMTATLAAAAAEAERQGRDYVGTEHLLLGSHVVDPASLAALLGTEAGLDEVRGAVADAITSGDEARDAEARRQGWRPELDAAPDLGERIVAGAREAVEFAEREIAGGGDPPGCWPGLMAVILLNEDEELGNLLADMQLEPAAIHELCAEEPDLPVADGVALAKPRRPGEEPTALDFVVALVGVGSPRVEAALDRLGLTPVEVVAQLSEWRLEQEGNTTGSPAVLAATALNLLAGAVVTVALLQVAISQGAWWKLVFLWIVWSGHPGYGPLGSVAVAGVLALAVSPLVGALHLVGTVADLIQARAERQAVLARTGVRLSLRELRCVRRRRLGIAGAFNQLLRQMARGAWRRAVRRLRRGGG